MKTSNDLERDLNSLIDTIRDLRVNLIQLKKALKKEGLIAPKIGRSARKTKLSNFKCGCWNFAKCRACYNLGNYRWKRGIKDEIFERFEEYKERKNKPEVRMPFNFS